MKKLLLASVASVIMGGTANAAVITSLPGGTALPIPTFPSTFTTTPLVLAPGIVASPNTTFTPGYTGFYGFNSNGFWSGTSMIGLDLANGFFTIDFATPIQAFLGELNWTTSNSANNASIEIYGTSGLLESLTLENGSNLVSPGFHGFSRNTADITKVRFNNEYIGVRNISILASSAVPEPATWAMMLVGFGAMGVAMRRRQKATVSFA